MMVLLIGYGVMLVLALTKGLPEQFKQPSVVRPIHVLAFLALVAGILFFVVLRRILDPIIPVDPSKPPGQSIVPLGIRIMAEGGSVEQISENQWRIVLHLTIFNDEPSEIVLYDMSVQKYEPRNFDDRPSSIADAAFHTRQWLRIDKTNSILSTGVVVAIPSESFHPFSVELEVTAHIDNITKFARFTFGLLARFHVVLDEKRLRVSVPSSDLFIFERTEGSADIFPITNSAITALAASGKRGHQSFAAFLELALARHRAFVHKID